MFGAMGADGIAVLGRHAGFAFIGAIELFQACLAVSLSCAILVVTLADANARVDLLLGRVPPRWLGPLTRIGHAALALTFTILAAGSGWIAADLWHSREQTELLAIPLLPLRCVWVAACALAAWHFVRLLLRARRT